VSLPLRSLLALEIMAPEFRRHFCLQLTQLARLYG